MQETEPSALAIALTNHQPHRFVKTAIDLHEMGATPAPFHGLAEHIRSAPTLWLASKVLKHAHSLSNGAYTRWLELGRHWLNGSLQRVRGVAASTLPKGAKDVVIRATAFEPQGRGGRLKYGGSSDRTLAAHGDADIVHARIIRAPIIGMLVKAHHLVEANAWNKRSMPYDDTFHVALILDLSDGSSVLVEKDLWATISTDADKYNARYAMIAPLDVTRRATLDQLLNLARKDSGDAAHYDHDAWRNNGLSFVRQIVDAAVRRGIFKQTPLSSHMLSQDARDFLQEHHKAYESQHDHVKYAGSFHNALRSLHAGGFWDSLKSAFAAPAASLLDHAKDAVGRASAVVSNTGSQLLDQAKQHASNVASNAVSAIGQQVQQGATNVVQSLAQRAQDGAEGVHAQANAALNHLQASLLPASVADRVRGAMDTGLAKTKATVANAQGRVVNGVQELTQRGENVAGHTLARFLPTPARSIAADTHVTGMRRDTRQPNGPNARIKVGLNDIHSLSSQLTGTRRQRRRERSKMTGGAFRFLRDGARWALENEDAVEPHPFVGRDHIKFLAEAPDSAIRERAELANEETNGGMFEDYTDGIRTIPSWVGSNFIDPIHSLIIEPAYNDLWGDDDSQDGFFRNRGAEEVDRCLAEATKGQPIQTNMMAEKADAPIKDVRRLFAEGAFDDAADSVSTP